MNFIDAEIVRNSNDLTDWGQTVSAPYIILGGGT